MEIGKKLLYICILLTNISHLIADNRIIMYLNKPPAEAIRQAQQVLEKEYLQKKVAKIEKRLPSKNSKKRIKAELKKNLVPKLSGFMALYSGYSDYSDPDGLISFPLRHLGQKLYLVITKKIKLEKVKGSTISHLEFETKDNKTEVYLFEKKLDNKKKNKEKTAKEYFWEVRKQDIPKNKIIHPFSVVILAHPKNFYIPSGDFIAEESKHLVLPKIYTVGNVDRIKLLLQSFDTKKYFEHIDVKEQKVSDVVYKKIITNS